MLVLLLPVVALPVLNFLLWKEHYARGLSMLYYSASGNM